jgi:L-aspartate oxidase
MLEVLVFSKRITQKSKREKDEQAAGQDKRCAVYHILREWPTVKAVSSPTFTEVQSLLWDRVGIMRCRESLTEAAETLAAWQKPLPVASDRHSYELSNLVLVSRLVTEAALLREESRGAHFRTDFPQSSTDWLHHLVFTNEE